MIHHFSRMLLVLITLSLAGSGLRGTVSAQDAPPNLLLNGDLETPYYVQDEATRTVPNGWNLWIGAGDPQSIPNKTVPQVRTGYASWQVRQDGAAFTAAAYQTVEGITPGDRLRFSAYGWAFTCDDPATRCASADPPYAHSNPVAGVALRVGIDPTGGQDPLAGTVQWSETVAPYDQWIELDVVTTAQGETVTVFMYMTQVQGLALNSVYWDTASLVVTDAPDTGSEQVPFVVPQGVRPDGSIVHIVQAGDTLWSIAYAYLDYGVTVESIAALNEGIKPTTRFLQPGQELLILPPGSVDPVTGQPVGGEVVVTPATPSPLESSPSPTTASPVPVTATATPAPTATVTPTATTTPTVSPPPPTATLPEALTRRTGFLCATGFADTDHDGLRDPDEEPLPGLTLVITGPDTSEQITLDDTPDPLCLETTSGTIEVLAMPPDGVGLTTPAVLRVMVGTDRQVVVEFGGATGYIPPTLPPVTVTEPAIDPGLMAPVAPTASAMREHDTWLDQVYEQSGWIVLGAAAVIGAGSAIALLAIRRR